MEFYSLAGYLVSRLIGFVLQSDCLVQIKTTETARWDHVKTDRDRLIEVKNYGQNCRS